MGAVLGAVLANPLTAKRDFAEHVLAAASPCIPPWSATGRVRANAAAFAVRRVHGQVHCGAGTQLTPEQPLSALLDCNTRYGGVGEVGGDSDTCP